MVSATMSVCTLERMTTPPTQAVANLHLHLEYDSGLDVIAAAMATVPEGGAEADEYRAHVSHDISSAVAHLLDVGALTPEGSPVRVTDVSMEVLIDIDEPHTHGEGEDPEQTLSGLLATAEEFAKVFDGLDFTRREAHLVAQAPVVGQVTGPPPFDEMPEGMTTPQLLAEWGILCGYLAEACTDAVDRAFDDITELVTGVVRGQPFSPGFTVTTIHLPEAWEDQYGIRFFRKFILTLSEMSTRLTHQWEPPSNLAQVLALEVILGTVIIQIDEDQEADENDEQVRRPSDDLLEILHSRLVDRDFVADIFDAADEMVSFDYWFVPFTPEERVAPAATDGLD